uniref:Odorant receptor n=1 Tax=Anopheles maculatus TaxID=74869 RepID=A0A182SPK1_9DIPT
MQWNGILRRIQQRLYVEQDFFRPYEILLALSGLHLDGSRNKSWVRVLFMVSRTVLLLQYALWADRFYLGLIDAPQHSGKALHYGNTFGVLTMMLVRMLVVRWYLPNVEQLMRYLREQRRHRKLRSSTFRVSYRKIANIAVTFQLIGLADRVVFCFSRTYREELYEMPSNLVELGWPMVVALHVLSFDFASRWAAAYNVSLTGMNSIMMGLYDELVDIADDYSRMFEGAGTDGEFWTGVERHIAQTVKRHEAFISQLNQLKPFLHITFLVMLYSAALFLAIGMFMITANGTTMYDVILSGFLFALLLECYWCCRLVDRLNDMNTKIGDHLYSLAWPTELQYTGTNASRYRQVRSSLLIMMSMTQKTLGISCGGMFEMSSEAFASLVKMTYTVLMFLRDTQNLS